MNFNSDLLNSVISAENLIIAFLGLLVILLAWWVIRIENKLNKVLLGKNAKTLDDSLETVTKNLQTLNGSRRQTEGRLAKLEEQTTQSIRGVETLRFNPFAGDGSGGKHSFATAFLSEKGDGVVISSLYTRERTNMFSKQLSRFQPSQELSEEETEAVNRAKQRINSPAAD